MAKEIINLDIDGGISGLDRAIGVMYNMQKNKLDIGDYPIDLYFTDDFLLKYYNLEYIPHIKDFMQWAKDNMELLDSKTHDERFCESLAEWEAKSLNKPLPPKRETWIDRLKLKK